MRLITVLVFILGIVPAAVLVTVKQYLPFGIANLYAWGFWVIFILIEVTIVLFLLAVDMRIAQTRESARQDEAVKQALKSATHVVPAMESPIECSNVRLLLYWFSRGEGVVNIQARVQASFKNKDIEYSHSLEGVEMVIILPGGTEVELYQITGEILRDYKFEPSEARSDDIMRFQTKVESRLPEAAFASLYPANRAWKVEFVVKPGDGSVQRIPVPIIDLVPEPEVIPVP